MVKKILFFLFFILVFVKTVFADDVTSDNFKIIDEGDVFSIEDELILEEDIDNFVSRTGYNVIIQTIDNLNGEDINSLANYNMDYLNLEEKSLYFLISKEDGNMIIKTKEINSEIVTDELIEVMMMSVITDFENMDVISGLEASLTNGAVLIEENIKSNIDTHETLEIKDTSKESNMYLIICVICVVVFCCNIVFLVLNRKKD